MCPISISYPSPSISEKTYSRIGKKTVSGAVQYSMTLLSTVAQFTNATLPGATTVKSQSPQPETLPALSTARTMK